MRVYFFHGLVLIHRSYYLARIFRLLGPIPRLSPLHPSRTLDKPLKFWAPHCWKITDPSRPRPRWTPRDIFSRSRRSSTNISSSLFLSLPRYIILSLLVHVSSLSVLVALPHPPFDSSSGTLYSVRCSPCSLFLSRSFVQSRTLWKSSLPLL